MTIEANFISGLMLGCEYAHSSCIEDEEDEDYHMIVIDLLFVRFIIAFE